MGLKYVNVEVGEFIKQAQKAVTDNAPANAVFQINGERLTKPQFLARLNAMAQRYDAAEAAKTALSLRASERDAAEPDALRFMEDYVGQVRGLFGNDPATLAKFAIPVRRTPRSMSLEDKLARTSKAAKTRELRGTKGKKEKEAIKAKGDFTVTVSDGSSDSQATTRAPSPTATPAPAPAPVVTMPAPVINVPAPVINVPAPVINVPAPVITTPAPQASSPISQPVIAQPVIAQPSSGSGASTSSDASSSAGLPQPSNGSITPAPTNGAVNGAGH